MDGIPPIDAFMNEIWNIYSGRDLKKFEKEKEYNSKTLIDIKGMLKYLKAKKKGKAIKWLSVGVGEGRDLEVLCAKGLSPINIDFWGIDLSKEHFAKIEERANELEISKVTLEVISAEKMNFKSKFDLISAILVLHEVDPVKLPWIIKNMLRALKKDGTLVISDFQKPYELKRDVVVWNIDDITYLLKQISPKSGVSFEIMKSREYPEDLDFILVLLKR